MDRQIPRLLRLALVASLAIAAFSASAYAAGLDRYSKNISRGNAHAIHPDVNEWGSHVAFVSASTNIADGTPGTPQIFVEELRTGKVELISKSRLGEVAHSDTAVMSLVDPFNTQDEIDPLTALNSGPTMSVVGKTTAFASNATNLTAGDTNGATDVFVYGRNSESIELVSVAVDGGQANGPSWHPSYGYNSRYIGFLSAASNLVAGDKNGKVDAFMRDMSKRKTYLVSADDRCRQANADSTDVVVTDGRYGAFSTAAGNLVKRDTNRVSDVFIHKFPTPKYKCGDTYRMSVSSTGKQANGPSQNPSLGANGKYIAFESTASNLVAGDTNGVQDIFWRIRTDTASWLKPIIKAPKTLRVSVTHESNRQANGPSYNPEITVAGRFIYFDSAATNIFKEDTDTVRDVYHHDLKSKWTTLSSRRDGRACKSGAFECTEGTALGGIDPSVSYHGTQVLFMSPSKTMRDEAASEGLNGIIDVVWRHIGEESGAPPKEYR